MAVHHHAISRCEDPPVLDDTVVARLYKNGSRDFGSFFEVYEIKTNDRCPYEYRQVALVSPFGLLSVESVEGAAQEDSVRLST